MIRTTIIHANPNPESFGHFLVKELGSRLKISEVNIRDLYQLSFDPVLTSKDLNSYRNSEVDQNLVEEQNIISNNDLLLFVFPLWWGGLPAILKGYFDRVMSFGFAYKNIDGKIQPGLSDKKSIMICTHGESEEKYSNSGFYDSFNQIIQEGIFDFAGIDNLKNFYFQDPVQLSKDEIEIKLKEIVTFIQNQVV